MPLSRPTPALLAALGIAAALAAGSTHAQAPGSAPAPQAERSAEAQAAEDRVVDLVQHKRCSAAHDEAVKAGLTSLAEQVAAACGTRIDGPSPKSGGGGSGRGRRGPPS